MFNMKTAFIGATTLIISMLFASFSMAAVWTIIYPKSEIEDDIRSKFPVALLELSLQKTGVRFKLQESSTVLRQARAVKRLEESLEINVMWAMTDIQREQQLRPIRVPITRGLIGLRALVAHKNGEFLNAQISSIDDLLKYSPVQGTSWPDTKILQANGFNVITSQDYISAANLTENKLADFFPRSVTEVFSELGNGYSKNLRLKKGVYISYPAAYYFFTNKRNLTLSRLIETGLKRAIEDGSYNTLFDLHFGEILQKIELDKAIVFHMVNPLLPPLTPISDEKLWYFYPTIAPSKQ